MCIFILHDFLFSLLYDIAFKYTITLFTVADERQTNLNVVRYTIYISMAFLITSFVCAVLNITKMKHRKDVGYMASCLAFSAGGSHIFRI